MTHGGPARIKPCVKSGCESGGEAFVAMMQAAGLRDFDHLSDPARHDRA